MKLWTRYAYIILNQNKATPSFYFVIRGKRSGLDMIASRQCRNFMHNMAVMSTSLSRHTFPRKARQDTSGFLYGRDWMRNFVCNNFRCNKWSQDCTCLQHAICIYLHLMHLSMRCVTDWRSALQWVQLFHILSLNCSKGCSTRWTWLIFPLKVKLIMCD